MATQRAVPSSITDTPWLQLGTDLRAAVVSNAPVLITGHRDVGKLIARALHDRSTRGRRADFVEMTHDALYEKLASLSAGALSFSESAGQPVPCTLFVDDIHELSPAAQEMLQYFLDVAYQAGSSRQATGPPTVRMITATSDDLSERMASGLFRADLFYRLNVIHLAIPSVWDVTEDSQVHALLDALD